MNLFQLFHRTDINEGIAECRETEHAVLLDVRTREEYREGHIPGSVNIPLDALEDAEKTFPTRKPRFSFIATAAGAAHTQSII